MKDKAFIQSMLQNGERAREKMLSKLSGLSFTQLNWKPSPESWSIGQCLDHLVISDCQYFPALKKLTEGNGEMSFWEEWSPLSRLFGYVLVSQVSEEPRNKMNAPRNFIPSESSIDFGIYERFTKHLESLLEYISNSVNIDLDRIRITSPVSKFITYSLRNAFRLLIQHEHRHLNQAIKLLTGKNFPKF